MVETDIEVDNCKRLGYLSYIKNNFDNDIVIISQNVRSANANGNKLKEVMSCTKADVVFIQETWGHDLSLAGYDSFTESRPSRGGGVSIVTQSFLNCKLIKASINNNMEYIIAGNKKQTFISIYRPPSGDTNDFFAQLRIILTDAHISKTKITIGADFNIDMSTNVWESTHLQNLLLDHNIIKHSGVKTRIATNKKTNKTTETEIDAIFFLLESIFFYQKFSDSGLAFCEKREIAERKEIQCSVSARGRYIIKKIDLSRRRVSRVRPGGK